MVTRDPERHAVIHNNNPPTPHYSPKLYV